MFDVVVIGGGPAGYVAAIRSSQLGLYYNPLPHLTLAVSLFITLLKDLFQRSMS